MSNNNSTQFASLVTMGVVSCLLVNIVETTVRSGTVTLEPARVLTWFASLEDSDLRLNSVGPEFINDVNQLLRRIH